MRRETVAGSLSLILFSCHCLCRKNKWVQWPCSELKGAGSSPGFRAKGTTWREPGREGKQHGLEVSGLQGAVWVHCTEPDWKINYSVGRNLLSLKGCFSVLASWPTAKPEGFNWSLEFNYWKRLVWDFCQRLQMIAAELKYVSILHKLTNSVPDIQKCISLSSLLCCLPHNASVQ